VRHERLIDADPTKIYNKKFIVGRTTDVFFKASSLADNEVVTELSMVKNSKDANERLELIITNLHRNTEQKSLGLEVEEAELYRIN
jgi:hypothetical protein